MIPHVHGPAFRRPGLEYMGAAMSNESKSSLRGFNFSTTTGFILELHEDGLQVWSNGLLAELVNPVELPYSEAECAEVQMSAVNDVIYLSHPEHRPRKLARYPDDSAGRVDWRLEEIDYVWPPLGDENVRSDEIASPAVTELLSVPTYEWEEFTPTATPVSTAVTNADTTAETKTLRLQRIIGGVWTTIQTTTWTTVAPTIADKATTIGVTHRLTYTGPVTGSSDAEVVWAGGGAFFFDLGIAQPESIQSVTVVAGEWQVNLDATGDTLTTGTHPKLRVEKFNGTNWVLVKQLTPISGEIVTWRGPAFTADTSVRLNWQGQELVGGEMTVEQVVYPTSTSITLACSHTEGQDRTLTASEDIFQAGHVGSYWQLTHRRDASHVAITRTGAATPGVAYAATQTAGMRVQGTWDVFTYGSWSGTLYLEKYVNGTWETLRSWESAHDRNVIATGTEDQEVELRLRVSAGNAISVTGSENPRFLLEAADARVSGIVKVTAVGSLTNGKTDTATVDVITTLYSTDATSLWTEGAWSDVKGYPRAVCIHGQRLWFAGTVTEPLRMWGSVANDFEDFRRSTFDDAGLSFTASELNSNAIQWLASHGESLIIGTAGEEGTLESGEDRQPITPTSVHLERRSGYGSQYLPAMLVGDSVVFVQRGGRKLRAVAPRADGVVWSASDLTTLASHVTESGVIQTAVMTHPFTILWCVTDAGKLIGMTYESDQNVYGWHVHETDGTFESVAVVQGSDADEVWVSVLRDDARSIERLDTQVFAQSFDSRETLIYLDSALVIELDTPGTELTGLDHLEGKTVRILGDGADMGTRLVQDGAVTVQTDISTAVVGLEYTSKLQPMRQEIPLRDGTSQFRMWRTSRIGLFVHDSLGGQIADSDDSTFESLNYRRAAHPMDAPPPLFTGEIETPIAGSTRYGLDVVIKTSGPHPLNVAAIGASLDLHGE